MRGGWKSALGAAILVLAAAGLGACGGSGAGDSTTGSSAASAPQSTAPATAGSQGSDSGSGTAADEGSAGFRTPGGDNSIQEYGVEADAPELDAASAALAGYLQARAADAWARECTYLSKATLAPLEQLATRSPRLEGKDCAAILKTLMSRIPVSTRANPLHGDIASLRVEGNRAFALFHGSGGIDYFVPMVEEGGGWKVGAIAPSEFP